MRKILLAATAVAAVAGIAGSAVAQTAAPSITPGRAGWVGNKGSGYPSAANEPGTVQVFLRGALYSGIFIGGAPGDTQTTATGTTKNNPYAFYNYIRLFPSMQATTARGLMYGAFGEIRSTTGTSTAGSNNSSSNLNWRRAYGYLGGSWGQVRFGALEGANAIMQTGTFENGTGLHNGDGPSYAGPAAFTWPFLASQGTGEKIVYLSPSFSGFDFGLTFEPGTNNINSYNNGPGGIAGIGAVRLDSLSGNTFVLGQGTLQRTKNVFEAVGRYQGNVGPVGVTASLGLVTAGLVKNSGLTGLAASGAPQYKYKNPFGVQGGLTVSYGGLTVGGAVYGGSVNPNNSRNYAPVKSGGKDALAFLVGASYATGPYSVTASIASVNRAGFNAEDITAANGSSPAARSGTMREMGYGVTGTYAYGPGAALNVDFIYSQRHQSNINLLAGGTAVGRAGNNVQAVALIINNTFVW